MHRLATFVVLCALAPVAAGASLSSEFSGPALVFKLIVANPDTVIRHVMKVGVRSHAQGNFNCLTESKTLISLADYPISFAVTREETLMDADPKISLPPGSSAAFTVSLYPHATGACGPWSSDVSVIVAFDDGTRLETATASIDESDLEALRTRNPQRDDVLQGLSHRNAELRLQSLRQLAKVGLDRVTLEDKVRRAFQDPDSRIRSEAYRQVAPLDLQTLTPDLIKRFDLIALPMQPTQTRQANSAELLELCQSFTVLRAAGAEDSVLAVLTNPNFSHPEALGDALPKIRTPAMPGRLMHVVAAHRTWASALPDDAANSDSPKLATRYHILLKNLIEYRDVSSVPLLKSLLIPPENKHTARVILSSVLALTNATHRVHDPFVLEFGNVARGFMKDPWGDDRHNLREPAMLLSVRALDDPAAQIPLLRAGLRDRSQYVQLAAAREAAALGLTSMAPEILQNYRGSKRNLQPHFCNALAALNVKCNEQGASP
jgi:hypothetical protein